MKKNLNFTIIFLSLSMLVTTSCYQPEINSSSTCIEGRIVSDSIYKNIYEDCYNNSFWIEVLNNDTLGKDVQIYTPAPSLNPSPPIKYSNVVEVPFLEQFRSNNRLDTLLEKKIYFHYRMANDNEMDAIRNIRCADVYETHEVPILIITEFSFSDCSFKI